MSEEKRPFIKENVNKKPVGKKVRKIIWIIGGGILFGLVAVVVFVFTRPMAEKYLVSEEETTVEQTVVIPRDNIPAPTDPEIRETREAADEVELPTDSAEKESAETDDTQKQNETGEQDTGDGTTGENRSTVEDIEKVVSEKLEKHKYSADNLASMWSSVASLCNSLDTSVVVVKSVVSGTDIFENNLETEGTFSGIVVAETIQQVLILTVEDAVSSADSLRIIWNNGFEQKGYIRAIDKQKGLAVVAVNKVDMSEATVRIAVPVELGNSYMVQRGDMLIEMGSPNGIPHSTQYTWANYVAHDVNIIDGQTRLFYTEDECNCDMGTWVVNTAGQLVGWGTGKYSADEDGPRTRIIEGLSDYKKILERMINSGKYAFLGIVPVTVTEDMKSAGAPQGVFVSEVKIDSPAYKAGIQPGDVIVSIDDGTISGINDYDKALESLEVGRNAKVELFRSGRDEYVALTFDVSVSGR